jgi:hypothetical protein
LSASPGTFLSFEKNANRRICDLGTFSKGIQLKKTHHSIITSVLFFVTASFISLAASASATTSVVANGGFEKASTTNPLHPADWDVDGVGPAYALDATVRKVGKHALKIGFKDGANKEGYSGTIQKISATPYAGKRVEVTAYLRKSTDKSIVGIWAMLGGVEKVKLLYKNTYEQPAPKVGEWTQHKLVLDVPQNAVSMALGAAIYESDGEMWVDEFSVREVGAGGK